MTLHSHRAQAQAATTDTAISASRGQALTAGLLAAMFGAFLVLGVGFAHSASIHDAAHDTRHAFSFPCH